jgi:hypothetical protein
MHGLAFAALLGQLEPISTTLAAHPFLAAAALAGLGGSRPNGATPARLSIRILDALNDPDGVPDDEDPDGSPEPRCSGPH